MKLFAMSKLWPVMFLNSHFRMPELFNFLTTIFLALWLVSFLPGQLTFRGQFSFIAFMMLLTVFFPMGVFLYHMMVFGFR